MDYATIPAEKPPKLQRDWVGRLVRLRKDLGTNGGARYPAGLVMKVEGKYHGLTLTMPFKCPCCSVGQRYTITGVEPAACDLLPESTPEPEPAAFRPNNRPGHETKEPCK